MIVADLKQSVVSLLAELRLIRAWLTERRLWLLLALGLLLWSLAYAIPYAAVLHIGGDQRTALRKYDAPFLIDFNDSEPDDDQQPAWEQRSTSPYRWSKDRAAIQLPGLGTGSWLLGLRVSGQPGKQLTPSRWATNEQQAFDVNVAANPRIYYFLSHTNSGDLQLSFETPRLNVPNDPRNLGLTFYSLHATATHAAIVLPAAMSLALLLAMLTLLYGLQRRLCSEKPGRAEQRQGAMFITHHLPLLPGLLFILITVILLVTDRLGLTIWLPAGTMLAALCYLLVVLGEPLLERLAVLTLGTQDGRHKTQDTRHNTGDRGHQTADGRQQAGRLGIYEGHVRWRGGQETNAAQELPLALGTVIAGFAIRMAGLLHPYAQSSDIGFHVNNLRRLAWGQVFQTAGLPCEAGAGLAPYPPAQSIMLLPGLLFGSGEAWLRTWLRGTNALLESAAAIFIWLILRRAGTSAGVALLGAALYCVAPPLLGAYSIGEMANIFGQIWLPALLLWLIIQAQAADPQPAAPLQAISLFLVLLLMLSHTGVTISAVALLGAWWLLGLRSDPWRMRLLTAAGWLAAAGIAFVLFYSAYAYLPAHNSLLAAERLAANPSAVCPPELPLSTKLGMTLSLGLGPLGSLALPFVLVALVGTFVSQSRALRRLLLAAWLGSLLSFVTLLSSAQPVRWAHFLFPALCIAAAIGLGRWLRHGRSGQLFGWVVFSYILYFGLERWLMQIATYLH